MGVLLAVLAASFAAAIMVSPDADDSVVQPLERKRSEAPGGAGRRLQPPRSPETMNRDDEIPRVSALFARRIDGDLPQLFDSPGKAGRQTTGRRKTGGGVQGGGGTIIDEDDVTDTTDEDTPKAVVPAAPKAPPLPFTFLGRMLESGKTTFFLSMNGKTIIVKRGDTIGGIYRVAAIEKEAVEFIYLPLLEKQRLSVGPIGSKGKRS
jgi:hypothetical protein